MKKDILKKVALGSLVAVCCTGIFTACGKDDNPETPSTNYTLVFDEDNNASTDNITKVVAKNALNDKTNWPTLADENGYARQWVLKGWNKDTATLIASTSDGSQAKPYLISTEAHFKKMADSVSALTQAEATTYYQGNTEVESTQTYDKVVKETGYTTVEVTSTEQSGVKTWTYETSKQYFRLINDVVFDTQVITATGYSSFVLDGAKVNTFTNDYEGNYKLTNVNTTNFPSGYIFNIVVDTTIQNLDATLSEKLVQLVNYTSGGVYNEAESVRRDTTIIENVSIDSNGAPINQQGTNKSAFISHVMHDSSLNMTNCTMDVTKINSTSSYCGVFVGGYPKTNGKVTFTNCVNNADITTTGSIGLFFGNDTYKSNTIAQNIHEVVNCVNNGTVIGNSKSHVLVPFENTGNQTSTRFSEAETSVLDGGVAGKFANNGEFIALDANPAQISNSDIILPSNLLSSLEDGKTYSIVVNVENALHKLESDLGSSKLYSSITTNIQLQYELTVDGTVSTNFVMEDIYGIVLDVTKYCEQYGVNAQTIEWTNAGGYEYYLDKTNHCYVINTTEYFSVMKTETSYGNNVRYSVVVKDGDEIVALFSVDPKTNEL